MASHWSSEQVIHEFRETQATAMAVDANGQLAILAGRRAIAIVNLDLVGDKRKPSEAVKKIGRQSKWEVSAVQWNPHPSHAHLFVVACNMRADIWSWKEGTSEQLGSMKAHTRVISDVDWSPAQANTLATCSVDTFTYLWDMRDTRRPTMSLQAVAGASQVKWNKVNSHLLATAHDGDIRIWDPRKGTSPIQYIAAHLSKIHGLDWSPNKEFSLATSSQDCTIKIWDVLNPKQPEDKIPSACPVWRARYTPYGNGLMTVVVPQLRRGENSLFLWHLDNLKQPVHTFVGHTDVVLEFQWRKRNEGRDLQLVTWSKDQSLRLWRIDPSLRKLCGDMDLFDPYSVPGSTSGGTSEDSTAGTDMSETDTSTTGQISMSSVIESAAQLPPAVSVSPASPQIIPHPSQPISISPMVGLDASATPSMAAVENGGALQGAHMSGQQQQQAKNGLSAHQKQQLQHSTSRVGAARNQDSGAAAAHQLPSLQQEFSLANLNIPNVNLEEVDAIKRICSVSAVSGEQVCRLTMHFPVNYPNNEAPTFVFSREETSLDNKAQQKLIKVLRALAEHYVRLGRSCIEPCLRQLVSSMESLTTEPRESPGSDLEPPLRPASAFPRTASGTLGQPPGYLPLYTYGYMQDASVPFPRTSGARFCAAGFLVCFTRSSDHGHRRTSSAADLTPRAMSALSAYTNPVRTPQGPNPYIFNMARSPPTEASVSISKYFSYKESQGRTKPRARSRSRVKESGEMKSRGSGSSVGHGASVAAGDRGAAGINGGMAGSKVKKSGSVVVYNIACLLPVNEQLARDYVLDTSDVPAMCQKNARVAAAVGRMDLVQVWSMAAVSGADILKPDANPDNGSPWAFHPFGRKLLLNMLTEYASMHDVQTLAMLTCAFGEKFKPVKTYVEAAQMSNGYSASASGMPKSPSQHSVTSHATYNQYHTIHPSDTTLANWAYTVSKLKRSNSWSEVVGENYQFHEVKDQKQIEKEKHARNISLLDPAKSAQYDQFKLAYAALLYRWGLLDKRAEVLKYVSQPPSEDLTIEFTSVCSKCGEETNQPNCTRCNRFCVECSICRMPVKGSSNICLACGHGGHAAHMMEWFAQQTVCPTGCGCCCLDYTTASHTLAASQQCKVEFYQS